MSVNDFLAQVGDVHRANRFLVSIDGIDDKFQFLCRTTSVPENAIGSINIPFNGMNIPIAGDQTEKEWSVEVFVDINFEVRKNFELWMLTIRPQEIPGGLEPVAYMRTATVDLLNASGEPIRSYSMLRCFPTMIGAMEVSHDSVDTISVYNITFKYTSWIAS